MMCLTGRNCIKRMGIDLHNLLQTSESIMAANGELIKLDSTAFLDVSLGNATSSQPMYMMPQFSCLYLSQPAFKELNAVHKDFPTQVPEMGQMTTAAEDATAPPERRRPSPKPY